MASRITQHGMDSLFAQTFVAPRAYIPDGILSPGVTELPDSMPSLARPTPTAVKPPTDITKEPMLCVTPEKNCHKFNESAKRSKQRVRFDPTVTVESEDLPESLQGSSNSSTVVDGAGSTDSLSTIVSSDALLDETLEPICIMASDLHLDNWLPPTAAVESVLARPEMNSTLRLVREAKRLEKQQLDVPAAVRQKLQKCTRTRTDINEKACSKVNVDSDQFSKLASVNICEADVLRSAELGASSKVRHSQQRRRKKEKSAAGQAPDIMDMFTRDLEKETASYDIPGLPSLKNEPTIADHDHAFDVYRHIRSWEGT